MSAVLNYANSSEPQLRRRSLPRPRGPHRRPVAMLGVSRRRPRVGQGRRRLERHLDPGQYSFAARIAAAARPPSIADMSGRSPLRRASDGRRRAVPALPTPPFRSIDEDGFFLGALTILDRTPHSLTREQGDGAAQPGARVIAELRVRRRPSTWTPRVRGDEPRSGSATSSSGPPISS